MKNFKLTIFSSLAFLFILSSCHKDKPVTPTHVAVTSGFYVLNQGLFGDNNSTLSFYDYTTKATTSDLFSTVNTRGLGDTGNDIEVYGSKMYIVMNVSSTVEVVDPITAKSIKQIKLFNGTTARQPRDIAFYKGNAYVSEYDGTVAIIDTASLAVTGYMAVGRSPEQLAVANGKLYVANSGGLDFPNYDNRVSVINLATNTVVSNIAVVINPQFVSNDGNGNVYVLSIGNYGTIPSNLAVIDATTDDVKSQADFDASNMVVTGDLGYFFTSDGKIKVYNLKAGSVTKASFISDGTVIKTPYTLAVDATSGEVFVGDAKDYVSNGTVTAFDKNGKKEYSATVGINPGKIALIKK